MAFKSLALRAPAALIFDERKKNYRVWYDVVPDALS